MHSYNQSTLTKATIPTICWTRSHLIICFYLTHYFINITSMNQKKRVATNIAMQSPQWECHGCLVYSANLCKYSSQSNALILWATIHDVVVRWNTLQIIKPDHSIYQVASHDQHVLIKDLFHPESPCRSVGCIDFPTVIATDGDLTCKTHYEYLAYTFYYFVAETGLYRTMRYIPSETKPHEKSPWSR